MTLQSNSEKSNLNNPSLGKPEADLSSLSPLKRSLIALEQMQAKLSALEATQNEPIAIIGMACRFPGGSNSPKEFWQFLERGGDAVTEVPKDRWAVGDYYHPDLETPGKITTRFGAFLQDIDQFDSRFFSLSPDEARAMDPQQRLLLEIAWEALENAGQPLEQLAGSRTGVFVGCASSDYKRMQLDHPDRISLHTGTGTSQSVLAGRLSYLLDLRGPSLSIDTACSSSLVAVHLACQSLKNQDSDCALAAGVNLLLSPQGLIATSKMGLMSQEGHCKAFDARADGIVLGEGCGVIVLKRLSDAIAAGDPIAAIIPGSAINQDGHTNGLTAPNGLSQQALLRSALAAAQLEPSQISYIETHGTGTSLGDPIEFEALAEVLGTPEPTSPPCFLGALKTNMGHLAAAAGIAGLIKAVLALQHRAIPKSLHFQTLNPNISLAGTRFVIPTQKELWNSDSPRRAGVSSFGWSGTNCHLIVEEAPAPKTPSLLDPENSSQSESQFGADTDNISDRSYLLPLSARDPKALESLVENYIQTFSQSCLPSSTQPQDTEGLEISLKDISWTAALKRTHHDHRLFVIGDSSTDVVNQLQAWLKQTTGNVAGHSKGKTGIKVGSYGTGQLRRTVFVFPGQGSQWYGMAQELMQREPIFRDMLQQCDQIIYPLTGWSILQELQTQEELSRLNQIDVIQPLLFAIQVSLAALWRSWGVIPDAVVGHSMGEVAAAQVAGALSLEQAAKLICGRSRLLRQFSGTGAMLLVHLSVSQAEALIAEHKQAVAIAASNDRHSTVLSGDPKLLDTIAALLQEQNIFCRLIRADVAAHSPQIDSLEAEVKQMLTNLQPQVASVPIYSTVEAQQIDGSQMDKTYWFRNLRQPVLFAQTLEQLLEQSYGLFIEMSPHPILLSSIESELASQNKSGVAIPSLVRHEPEQASLLQSLGQLYTLGYQINWSGVYPQPGQFISLPAYPWQHRRFWLDDTYNSHSRHPQSQSELQYETKPQLEHPILGVALDLAHSALGQVWTIDTDALPEGYKHKVLGVSVFPTFAMVEAAFAAIELAFGSIAYSLKALELKRLLALPQQQQTQLQFTLSAYPTDSKAFHLYGRIKNPGVNNSVDVTSQPITEPITQQRQDSSPWLLYGSAKICDLNSETTAPQVPSLETLKQQCIKPMAMPPSWESINSHGESPGWCLEAAKMTVEIGLDIVLAQLHNKHSPSHLESPDSLWPGILERCFELAALAVPSQQKGDIPSDQQSIQNHNTFVPIYLDRVQLYARCQKQMWIAARRRNSEVTSSLSFNSTPEVCLVDLWLFNDAGQLVVSIDGLVLKFLSQEEINQIVNLAIANQTTPSDQDNNSETIVSSKPTGSLLEELEALPETNRWFHLLDYLRTEVSTLLGLDPTETVEDEQGFFSLGMNSMMTLRLRNHLEISLSCSLSPTVAFENSTIHALAKYLATEVLTLTITQPNSGQKTAQTDDWLLEKQTELKNLSDLELTELLSHKLDEIT